jgi:hypothetical protein
MDTKLKLNIIKRELELREIDAGVRKDMKIKKYHLLYFNNFEFQQL